MRILLCDDDSLINNLLTKYILSYFHLKHFPKPEIVSFPDGESLLKDIGPKDIVFLDIEMPGFDGIYVGNRLSEEHQNIIIIVISSFSEYLDDAMRFHVFRYLSKPLDKQRLFRNLDDALKHYNNISLKIAIETKDSICTLSTTDIISVEARERKVIVHTVQQDFISIHNMNYWKECLPSGSFFQTHRSFIVNFLHIKEFDHSLVYLDKRLLTAYLTRRKYHPFKDAYLLYLENLR